jgi:hypothetical protein
MSETLMQTAEDIEVLAPVRPEWESILTPEALAFVAALHREFNPRREELLAKREARKQHLDAGKLPDFLPAPDLRALMIIFRSTGPVISTRRSSRVAGIGATVQSASRTDFVS